MRHTCRRAQRPGTTLRPPIIGALDTNPEQFFSLLLCFLVTTQGLYVEGLNGVSCEWCVLPPYNPGRYNRERILFRLIGEILC